LKPELLYWVGTKFLSQSVGTERSLGKNIRKKGKNYLFPSKFETGRIISNLPAS